jgi:hypothetical protein
VISLTSVACRSTWLGNVTCDLPSLSGYRRFSISSMPWCHSGTSTRTRAATALVLTEAFLCNVIALLHLSMWPVARLQLRGASGSDAKLRGTAMASAQVLICQGASAGLSDLRLQGLHVMRDSRGTIRHHPEARQAEDVQGNQVLKFYCRYPHLRFVDTGTLSTS